MMNIIAELKKKQVLILGMGREGLSTYLFLRKKFPAKELTLADKLEYEELPHNTKTLIAKDSKLTLNLGKEYIKKSAGFDFIFVTPGISNSILDRVKGSNSVVLTNLALFIELFKGKIIGITGTKGKSTTASLIYYVLKKSGKNVVFGGNIGHPALSLIEQVKSDTIAVLELSSYQLMRINKSPNIVVIQDIVPEHLDYHGSFSAYKSAKENIVKYQTANDSVIYNSSSKTATDVALKSAARKIPFSDYSEDFNKNILPVGKIPLKGAFNLKNVIPAIIIGRMFGLSDKEIAEAVKSFKPLGHRLEFVAEVNGVEYYNDSLSTIPEAAIAAITAFPTQYKILILGGYDRGLNFAGLAKKIYADKIRGIILFPTTGKRIWQEIKKIFRDKLPPQSKFANNMKDAVIQANQWAKSGDVVLMSPASPSFSVFKNYEDRGNQFEVEVSKLQNKL